jgi:hypothetical protein
MLSFDGSLVITEARMYAKYTNTLPPTPCTDEMREKIVAYSRLKGQSISQTQREAMSLFLAQIDTNLTNEREFSDQKRDNREVVR